MSPCFRAGLKMGGCVCPPMSKLVNLWNIYLNFRRKLYFQISRKDIYFQSGIYCWKRNFLLGANLYWGGGKSAKTGKRLASSLNLLLKFREKYLLMYTNISILNQYVSETYCLLISANVIYENVTIIFNISFKLFFWSNAMENTSLYLP